jgi:hypothetical protein
MSSTPEETPVVDHSALRASLLDMVAALDAGEYDTIGIRVVEFDDTGSWMVYPLPS